MKKDEGGTKKCKYCQSDIDQKAKVCPVCKRPQKGRHGCLISVLAVLVFVVIVATAVSQLSTGPSNNLPSANGNSAAPQETNTPDLELLDYDSVSEGGLRYAVGHIRNNSDKTYSYVQVEINLFEDDVQVGSTLDNVNNLAPGATWEFKALILEDEANKFAIADITGW